MATALPFLAIASTAMSALGQIQQGKAANASAKYNAQVQENNAKVLRDNAALAGAEGSANSERQQMKTRATVGGFKAAQAANGIDVNSKSAVDVRSSAAELGQLDAITIRSNAARKAYGYETEAVNSESQAALDRASGKFAKQASYIGAASTILGGATKGQTDGVWSSWLPKGGLSGGDNFDAYGEGV